MTGNHSYRPWVVLFAVITLLLAACGGEPEVVIPPDVMPRQEFIEVYADALLIEAAYKQRLYKTEDPNIWIGKRYGELFERYQLDPERYKHSLDWYSSQTALFYEMYDEIIEKLNKMEARETDTETP
ncbi:MAG: DUF4296 domain-containing protein [Flavobacteriales bacterium]|nr:DUF4296 domain-containing protein [Flavobacteriales bacterium]